MVTVGSNMLQCPGRTMQKDPRYAPTVPRIVPETFSEVVIRTARGKVRVE